MLKLVIYTSSLFCNFTWFLQGLMIFQTGMNYAFCTLLMLKSVHFPMHKDTVRVKTKRTLISSFHSKICCFQYILQCTCFKVKNHTKLSFKKLNLVRKFSPLFDLSDFIMNSQLILLTGRVTVCNSLSGFGHACMGL